MQFNFGKPKVLEERVKRETVIPEPSYSIPIALTGRFCLSWACQLHVQFSVQQEFLTSTCTFLVVSTDAEVAIKAWLHAFATYSVPCRHSYCVYTAGITGLSAVEGNLVLAGVTGFLAAFLAFQVLQPHLYLSCTISEQHVCIPQCSFLYLH